METSLHIKPTNLQMFLDWNSNHSFYCKVAIIYSQALRVNMICSDPGDRQLFLESLQNKFIQSNYSVNHNQEQFERAMKVIRANYMEGQGLNTKGSFVPPSYILTMSTDLPFFFFFFFKLFLVGETPLFIYF